MLGVTNSGLEYLPAGWLQFNLLNGHRSALDSQTSSAIRIASSGTAVRFRETKVCKLWVSLSRAAASQEGSSGSCCFWPWKQTPSDHLFRQLICIIFFSRPHIAASKLWGYSSLLLSAESISTVLLECRVLTHLVPSVASFPLGRHIVMSGQAP